jgi:hypothetical protein
MHQLFRDTTDINALFDVCKKIFFGGNIEGFEGKQDIVAIKA